MRKIPIHWDDLESAFERNAPDTESFLDVSTGQVVSIVIGDPEAASLKAKVAARIEDYVRVDPASSREQYRWMEHFVGSVAEALGRLLKLQHEAHRADIQRRLREHYGDRDFVSRIPRYDVSSFLDWGVFAEAKQGGVYLPCKQVKASNAGQLAWLAEAVLISREESQMALSKLCHHPILFPFALDAVNASVLRSNLRLKVARQGLNDDFVLLESNFASY